MRHARDARDPAWYSDAGILWRKPLDFFPARHDTPAECLNCYVRLVLYATLAMFVLRGRVGHVVAGAAIVALLSVSFHVGGGGSEEYEDEEVPACTRSTRNNPFANVLLGDLASNPRRAAACAYDDHATDVEANFSHGLVKNMYDVYDKENGRRQFVTMPVTQSAPDTVAFAHFCYGGAGRPTCKEDTSRCTGTR